MEYLRSSSRLVVRLLQPLQSLKGRDLRIEGIPAAWNGKIRRLILEYCRHGSLGDLWVRRRRKQAVSSLANSLMTNISMCSNHIFLELTLWHIFRCLVDGISVLAYRDEARYNRRAGQAVEPVAFNEEDEVVVHFDLKPGNSKSLFAN